LGISYTRLGLHREAIESFKQVIRITPDFLAAHNSLVVSYNRLGLHKKAIEAYKRVIRIDPSFATIYHPIVGKPKKRRPAKKAVAPPPSNPTVKKKTPDKALIPKPGEIIEQNIE